MSKPNVHTERLQLLIDPELKATLWFLARLSKPPVGYKEFIIQMLEDGAEELRKEMPDIDKARLKLRLDNWRDNHEELEGA